MRFMWMTPSESTFYVLQSKDSKFQVHNINYNIYFRYIIQTERKIEELNRKGPSRSVREKEHGSDYNEHKEHKVVFTYI